MNPLQITNYTLTTCLGAGRDANWQKILTGESGLTPCNFFAIEDLTTWVGEVSGLQQLAFPSELKQFDCRNNRLAWLALQQDNFLASAKKAIQQYGAERVGIFLGTSTSGIHQTELAYLEAAQQASPDQLPDWYQYRTTHNTYSVVDFVQQLLGTRGVAVAISTACSSSAKVFASAQRAIENGLCDAAIVGGVDSLCLTTLYGFHSLQLVSAEKCKPFDSNRNGISIGEAGGFALLEKNTQSEFALLGFGESSDAYHMSSPHPDGKGALLAMQKTLQKAGIAATDLDYINLHGTGTQANDSAEAKALNALGNSALPCSSTKGWTGHALGAAGIVEASLCLLSMTHSFIPQSLHLDTPDAAMDIALVRAPLRKKISRVLSNSLGFGGSNCSILLGTTTC
ncbi:MAG TPA: beta-ketoacyl-[acyl-carrier-protein] synthase family protein [Cellvibrio sp.]|nr:beta-ketoacyl-[acyl-carrier-protein] synthase family protein [Cellvibrio sp.]